MPTMDLTNVVGATANKKCGGFGARMQKNLPRVSPGTCGWKKWEGAAICQAAFTAPETAGRAAAKCEGTSQGHSRRCGMFTAGMIETSQDDRDAELERRSLLKPLRQYLTNNMFDETQ